MKKLRIGVVGIIRGATMLKYCRESEECELVAICDKWAEGLERTKRQFADDNISYYTDYSEFLKCDTDAVVLANYATEHAPFAIAAMESGKNVISEVLPVQTMAQAVALIECCERTGKKYCYAENYCYMKAPLEMKKKYLSGELGAFEYGEGEYMHNCEPCWTDITYGQKDHWRNSMSAFFYCTHSVGPLLHISAMRPVSVTGFECPFNARMARMGARAGHTAIEMVTLENGAVVKSLHGVGCSKTSVWYSVYGAKGRIESAREDADKDGVSRVYTNLDKYEGKSESNIQSYIPDDELDGKASSYGHSGSDFYCMHEALKYFAGDKNADIIDEYEAIDMWMCGFFGYLSVLDGGKAEPIPDLHKKVERERYRNDNRCTEPSVAGEQLLPSYSKGNPDIPDSVYDNRRKDWESSQNK